MSFAIFAAFSLLLAGLAGFFGAKILGKFAWIFGWLRGMLGFALVAVAIFLVLVGLDMLSYKQLLSEKPILTISFNKISDQHFKSTVVYIEQGEEQEFNVRGDQWQVDARVIRWKGIFQMFGAKPGYRLDRLSGRYYSLEDERRNERSVHQLAQSEYGLDIWSVVKQNGGVLPLFDAVYGSATYLPMEDGAIYQVSLGTNGLVAAPLNPIADQAVNRWQ